MRNYYSRETLGALSRLKWDDVREKKDIFRAERAKIIFFNSTERQEEIKTLSEDHTRDDVT